jgi:hypothetical protein
MDNCCLGCGFRLTWSEQRRQFARAIQKYGQTAEEAKKIMPRCGACLTDLLSPHKKRKRELFEQRRALMDRRHAEMDRKRRDGPAA